MKLELTFNNLSLGSDNTEEKRKAAAAARAKKKAAEETIEEAFDRIGAMKLDEKELELYRLAREAFFAGKIGRLGEGKLSKGEVLSMGMRIKQQQEELLREQRIRDVLENKPKNFYIITDDDLLPSFIERVRIECRRQQEEWKDRFKVLGVESMTAGDFEGTGVDSYMDLSIGFAIWLPILQEGYYLPYGHVDMRGAEGFEHIPEKYAFKEGDKQLTRSKVIQTIAPYLSNKKHGKTFHMGSARYDLHMAINDGYRIRGLKWDTLDAMYIMTEHLDSYALKRLMQRYGKYIEGVGEKEIYTFEDLFGNGSPAPYNTELVGVYAIWDVYYGWHLFEWQFETMKKTNRLLDCYALIDCHLPETDVFMARAGFNIDLDELKRLDEEFDAKLQKAKKDLFSAYNIDDKFLYEMSLTLNGEKIKKWKESQQKKIDKLKASIEKQQEIVRQCEKDGKTHLKKYTNAIEQIQKYKKQLAEISLDEKDSPYMIKEFELTNNNHIGYLIYDVLKIEDKTPRVKKGKTRSTAADVLEMYFEDEESLKPLATIAEYEKLLNTYVRKIPEALEIDGRFHCEWKSTGTSTGRYSSSGYNGRDIHLLDEFMTA
jgi:DNA polymerase I